ncbi:hypothetical protein D3C75_935970 [compost metagenome]
MPVAVKALKRPVFPCQRTDVPGLLLGVGGCEANQVGAVCSVVVPHTPPDEAVEARIAGEHIGQQIGPTHRVIDILIAVPLRISAG